MDNFSNPNLNSKLIYSDLKNELILRNYSNYTIKTYIYNNVSFLNYINKNPFKVNFEDVNKYIFYLLKVKKLKATSVRIAIKSIKFFFLNVMNRDVFKFVNYPKIEKRLPQVLSRNEILIIANSINNIKHKLIILLAYSSGLRLNEIRNLKIKDINLNNITILVRNGKGNKDRLTIFSKALIKMISVFIIKKNTEDYLFHNYNNKPLSTRTFQKIFEKALLKSGIKKKASFHSLRHSFATHCMENGVAIRYIQKLLGHKRLSTTAIYTHLTNPALKNVKSPL